MSQKIVKFKEGLFDYIKSNGLIVHHITVDEFFDLYHEYLAKMLKKDTSGIRILYSPETDTLIIPGND